MARTIIVFNNDHDREELTRVMKATDLAGALWDVSQFIRLKYKTDDNVSVDELSEKFWAIMEEHNLDFEHFYT